MVDCVPDPIFDEPRMAQIYDDLDPDRSDLDVYAAIVTEFEARSVLDVGCGTGTFACMLSAKGLDVIGVDPAGASLDVARAKPEAADVLWVHGDATALPRLQVDIATMTANVAQVFLDDEEWHATLRAVRKALIPGGLLVFEVRDPNDQAWLRWSPEQSGKRYSIEGVGDVTATVNVTDVSLPFVSFRWTTDFAATQDSVISDSTLRFRSQAEIESSLKSCGYVLVEVRDAPDRPGAELVFVAKAAA